MRVLEGPRLPQTFLDLDDVLVCGAQCNKDKRVEKKKETLYSNRHMYIAVPVAPHTHAILLLRFGRDKLSPLIIQNTTVFGRFPSPRHKRENTRLLVCRVQCDDEERRGKKRCIYTTLVDGGSWSVHPCCKDEYEQTNGKSAHISLSRSIFVFHSAARTMDLFFFVFFIITSMWNYFYTESHHDSSNETLEIHVLQT
jgi:hypothetical protein